MKYSIDIVESEKSQCVTLCDEKESFCISLEHHEINYTNLKIAMQHIDQEVKSMAEKHG